MMRKYKKILLSEDMSLEEFFELAQSMELVTANVAYIKNKDTEDLDKMGTKKKKSSELEYKREKRALRAVKNGTRDVYSVLHGDKLVLNVKRKIVFRDSSQTNNG